VKLPMLVNGTRLVSRGGLVFEAIVNPPWWRVSWLVVCHGLGTLAGIIGMSLPPRLQVIRTTMMGERVWLRRDVKSRVAWMPEQ
jgi:hypothetical protein